MAFPLIPVIAIATAVYAIFKGGGSSSKTSESVSKWFFKNTTTGVVQLKPEFLPQMLSWLAGLYVQPMASDSEISTYGGTKGKLVQVAAGGVPASAVIAHAANIGMDVLLAVPGSGALWAVPMGAAARVARKFPDEGGTWALIVEGKPLAGVAAPSPAAPAPGAQNVAWQIPGAPGAPSVVPGVPPVPPGWGIPGVPPATGAPAVPGWPEMPAVPPGWLPPGVTLPPGFPIPGVTGPAPTIPGFPPAVPGVPPVAPPAVPGVATFTHTIKAGDIASRLSQWYTGDALRWQELTQTNPGLRVVNKQLLPVAQAGGPAFGLLPWKVNDTLILPPTWNGAKGPPVSQKKGGAVANITSILEAQKAKAGVAV